MLVFFLGMEHCRIAVKQASECVQAFEIISPNITEGLIKFLHDGNPLNLNLASLLFKLVPATGRKNISGFVTQVARNVV